MRMELEQILTSPKFRDIDHHFICILHITVVISSLRLVSRLHFAVVVFFQLTSIKKLICGVTDLALRKVRLIASLF